MVALEEAQSMLVERRGRIYGNMAPAQWRSIFERFVVFIRVSPWLKGKRPDVKVWYIFDPHFLT